jgi:5'(3')-deoxyribonucleotidase
MKKPLLAIDIDDTIADSTESLRLIANERTGLNLPPEAYKVKGEYWGYSERVWAEHGVDKLYAFQDHRSEMRDDQSNILVVAGAQEALKRLAMRYDIVFITARGHDLENATHRWLKQHFPDITFDVHFTDHHHDEDALTKGRLCKQLGAEILIDDNDDHCRSAITEGLGAVRFGDYGWHGEPYAEIPCCHTWKDVLEYFGVT